LASLSAGSSPASSAALAHSAYTVTGEAANLAARLMERAAPGETLVAEALRQATENVAAFEELGVQLLNGPSAEPLNGCVSFFDHWTVRPV
jgi:class 3 adenylate cyclase